MIQDVPPHTSLAEAYFGCLFQKHGNTNLKVPLKYNLQAWHVIYLSEGAETVSMFP